MRRTSFRAIIHSVLCLTACLALAACDNAPPPTAKQAATPAADKKGPLIGLFLYKSDDTYISMVADALKTGLAGSGNLTVFDAKNDQLTQNDQFERMLEKKPRVLIINMVDPKSTALFVAKARQTGVPLIFFNREPDLDVLKPYDKACFVGTTALEAGIMQGDIIKQLWDKHPEYDRNKDGKLQYIMFQGDPDNPEAVARTEYSVKNARAKGLNMVQLGGTYICDWDEGLARKAMETAFAAYGDAIELIIANNDSMALGAIAALNAHGYNTGNKGGAFIPVVGVDATEAASVAIKKGMMSATVKQDSQAMADAIASLARNALKGKAFLDGTGYAWDESGRAIRIPYSSYMEE